MVVINKADLLDAARLVEVEAAVDRHLRPAVKTLRTSHGAIDVAVLLGLAAEAADAPDSRWSYHAESGEHDHDEPTTFSDSTRLVLGKGWLIPVVPGGPRNIQQ